MLTQDDMSRLQAEEHSLIDAEGAKTREEYVLQLIHEFPYQRTSRLTKDKKVLDLGCNTGYGTEILAKLAREVTGIDVSEKAISVARNQYQRPNLRFEVVDGTRLPFRDGEFDIIVSFQVIEHIVDYSQYVGELRRILAPAGIVLLTTPNALIRLDPGMRPWNKFHNREFDAPQLRTVLGQFFPAVEILGLFAEEHFSAIEHARVDKMRRMWRIGRFLPDRALGLARRLRNGIAGFRGKRDVGAQDQSEFTRRFSLADMSYRRGDLSAALDLMAICSGKQTSLEATAKELTS